MCLLEGILAEIKQKPFYSKCINSIGVWEANRIVSVTLDLEEQASVFNPTQVGNIYFILYLAAEEFQVRGGKTEYFNFLRYINSLVIEKYNTLFRKLHTAFAIDITGQFAVPL